MFVDLQGFLKGCFGLVIMAERPLTQPQVAPASGIARMVGQGVPVAGDGGVVVMPELMQDTQLEGVGGRPGVELGCVPQRVDGGIDVIAHTVDPALQMKGPGIVGVVVQGQMKGILCHLRTMLRQSGPGQGELCGGHGRMMVAECFEFRQYGGAVWSRCPVKQSGEMQYRPVAEGLGQRFDHQPGRRAVGQRGIAFERVSQGCDETVGGLGTLHQIVERRLAVSSGQVQAPELHKGVRRVRREVFQGFKMLDGLGRVTALFGVAAQFEVSALAGPVPFQCLFELPSGLVVRLMGVKDFALHAGDGRAPWRPGAMVECLIECVECSIRLSPPPLHFCQVHQSRQVNGRFPQCQGVAEVLFSVFQALECLVGVPADLPGLCIMDVFDRRQGSFIGALSDQKPGQTQSGGAVIRSIGRQALEKLSGRDMIAGRHRMVSLFQQRTPGRGSPGTYKSRYKVRKKSSQIHDKGVGMDRLVFHPGQYPLVGFTDQDLAVVVPVTEDGATGGRAIQVEVVLVRAVSVAMNELRDPETVHRLHDALVVDIGDGRWFLAGPGDAFITETSRQTATFVRRPGQGLLLPVRLADHTAELLIVVVVGTEGISVTQQCGATVQVQDMVFRKDRGPAGAGKLGTDQEVTIAVQEENRDAAVAVAAQGGDGFAMIIQGNVIAQPGIEQVTEDIQCVGLAACGCQKPVKQGCGAGLPRREMQIGNEINGHRRLAVMSRPARSFFQ